MSDDKNQIEDENQLQPNEGLLRSINTVTPLSKYLAMVLFILLPFIGGWIGYMYAPATIVEIETERQTGTAEGLPENVLERTDNLPSTLTPANEIILPNGMSLEEYSELRGIETDRDAPWKTYRNEEYGIEFQYPNSWKQDRDTFISTYGEGDYAHRTNMSIQAEENIHDLNPAERAQKFSDEELYLYSSVATGTIDGYAYFHGLVGNWGMSKYRQVILTKDENILILSIEYFYEEAHQDFNAILKSLRIIDSKNAWQTYHNEEYGFEFEYPADWYVDFDSESRVGVTPIPPEDRHPHYQRVVIGFSELTPHDQRPDVTDERDKCTNVSISGFEAHKCSPYITFAGHDEYFTNTLDSRGYFSLVFIPELTDGDLQEKIVRSVKINAQI